MPTEKQRISIVADDQLVTMIEMYQRDKDIKSMSRAAAELIKKGLLVEDERLHNGQVYDGKEIQLVRMFRRATEEDREEILDAIFRSVTKARSRRMSWNADAEQSLKDLAMEDIELLFRLYREAPVDVRREVMELLNEEESCNNRTVKEPLTNRVHNGQENQQTG